MANKQVTLKRVIDTSGNTDTIHPTTDWAQVESKPSTFTPTAHTHTLSDITDAGTVAAINLNSSTTQFLRGDGTFASVDSGNQYVNISGDTMTGNLTIDSVSFASLTLDRQSTTSSSIVNFTNNNGTVGGIGGFGNDGLQFRTTDGTQMVLDSSNNLGVGTETPTQKLDVSGSIRASSNMYAARYYDLNNSSYYVDPASTSIINQLQVGLTGADYLTLLGSNSLQFDRDGTSYIDQKGTGNLAFRFGSSYATRMTITNDGKVGIGDTTPSYPLEVAGDMAVNKIFDRNNGSYYLDPGAHSILNTVNVQRLEVEGAIYDVENDQLRMPLPKGGYYTNGSSNVTGAIEITLPSGTHGNYSMISFFVDVFDYNGGADGESFTMHLGGYVNGTTWTHTFANMVTVGRTDRFFNVRYNVDGTANKIYIAETTNNWSYPKIQIRDFMAGHSGADDGDWYNNAFTIDITTTIDGTTVREKSLESVATWADQVDVNSSSSSSYYNLLWHSGDTIYYAGSNKLRVQPSTGNIQIDGNDVATQNYVDTELANLVASAPSTLDTLNELAAALGDDANFSTTMTNSLAGKLSKTGNDTMTGDLTLSNSNPVLILNDTGTTTGNAYVDYQAGTSLKVHAGNDALTFVAGNTERARISSGGNLGIGTTNPSERLEVIGNFKIKTGAGYSNYGLIDQTEAKMDLKTYSSNPSLHTADITFQPGLTERMRITDDGLVGIGTSSPASKLEVAGDIQLQRSNEIIFGETVGGNPRAVIFSTENEFSSDYNGLGFSIGNQGRTGPSMYIRSDGKVGIGTTTPDEKLTVSGKIKANDNFEHTGTGGYYLLTSSDGFRGAFYDNGTTTSIYGDGNGTTPVININSDKVGIGTTNPDEKLHIEGNILVDAYNNSPGDSGIFFREGYTASQPSGATQPYNVSITLYDGSNGGASYDGLAVNGFDGVAVRTNNESTPKMVVKKSGDVGIGTETPSAKLNIVDTTSGSDLAKFRNDTDTTDVTIKTTSGAIAVIKSGGGDQLQLASNNNDTNGIRITTAGNVGIGTTSPSYKLDVSGNLRAVTGSSTKIWAENTTTGQTSLELKNSNTHLRLIGQLGGFQLYDQLDAASRFEIDTNGNSKIFGNLTIQSNFPRIYLPDTDDNPDYSIFNGNGAFAIYDDTNSTYRLRINSTGNVGVGVDSPSYKLDVAGDVNVTGNFKVNGTNVNGYWKQIKTGSTTITSGTAATSITVDETLLNQGGQDQLVIAFELNTSSVTNTTSQVHIVKLENSSSSAGGVLFNASASNTSIQVGSIRVYRGLASTQLTFTYSYKFTNGSSSEIADTVYVGRVWKLVGVEGV